MQYNCSHEFVPDYMITLAVKRRRKGTVIILCVCVCVWKILGNLQTLVAPTSYWQTSNYTRIKNNKRLLLKHFGYNTSKHKYSSIMTITSEALHRALAPSISHYFQAPPISIFKAMCSARDRNVGSFEDLSRLSL